MAVWFMDDGNAARRKGVLYGYHLNSQSFSEAENQRLADAIDSAYGIHCTVERNHSYYRLAVWRTESRERFARLIKSTHTPLNEI